MRQAQADSRPSSHPTCLCLKNRLYRLIHNTSVGSANQKLTPHYR
jgi:hypothetical protein